MQRWVAAVLALSATLAMPLRAQQETPTIDRIDRKVPRWEFGLYGGLAPTSDWLGVNEDFVGLVSGVENNDLSEGFDIGTPPIFGTTASWYFSRAFGLRLHAAYMPSEFPTRGSTAVAAFGELGPAVLAVDALAEGASGYSLNNWFLDLNLLWRPWTRSSRGWLASTYFFAGGGLLTTDVSGDADPGDLFTDEAPDVVDAFEALGANFSYERRGSTVGQGTAGLGINFFPFGRTLGFFGELALHGYGAPIETPAEDDPAFALSVVESRFAWTTRAVVGLKLALGDLTPPVPVPVPGPRPEPRPLPEPPPLPEAPTPPEIREEPVRVCVIEDGVLQEVDAVYRPATGDTAVVEQGIATPLAEAYPVGAPPYPVSERWFLDDEPLTLNERQYVKFGIPRTIPPTQLTRVGEFRGTPLFAETGDAAPYEVVYVPLGPGCRFQPYQVRERIRVRG